MPRWDQLESIRISFFGAGQTVVTTITGGPPAASSAIRMFCHLIVETMPEAWLRSLAVSAADECRFQIERSVREHALLVAPPRTVKRGRVRATLESPAFDVEPEE